MRISTKEFGRRVHNSSPNRFIPEDPSTSIFRDNGQVSPAIPMCMCMLFFLANIPHQLTPFLSWRGGQLSAVPSG